VAVRANGNPDTANDRRASSIDVSLTGLVAAKPATISKHAEIICSTPQRPFLRRQGDAPLAGIDTYQPEKKLPDPVRLPLA
jgi:hypothetical protein